MSHIPSSAMKHAGPVHHDHDHEGKALPVPPKPKHDEGGIGTGAWIAIGGTLLAGAIAAVAVPLLRRDKSPVPTRRGKKATPGKGPRKPKADKSAQD